MKMISIPKNTIIITIGPSNCGKSTLVKDKLLPFLDEAGIRHKYLSTDDIRRELVGEDLHKHSSKLQQVNRMTFDTLYQRLDVYTKYPVNTPIVIVDGTNLSKMTRADIIAIAKRNSYNLVGLLFDYKDSQDYYTNIDPLIDKRVIREHVFTLRNETVRELERKDFHSINRIDKKDFSEIDFYYSEANVGFEVHHDNVCVVGDLHGCYDELIDVLADDKGIEIVPDGTDVLLLKVKDNAIEKKKYVHHVLIGDLIDKGPDVEKLIRFISKNRDFFTIVEGNHDRWNYNLIKGKIKKDTATLELIDSYFDSAKLFAEKEDLKEMFVKLYEGMFTFVYSDKFIVTHAPCKVSALGKSDKFSLKEMNTTRYPKKVDYENEEDYLTAMEDYFKYLITEADANQPVHVFGHLALKTVFSHRNKYGIDTGCVYGNKLSTLVFMHDNKKPFVKQYRSYKPVTAELIPLFRFKQNEIRFEGLDYDVQKRVKYAAVNGVNFVSGTMSPTDKDVEYGRLESLAMGIKYYYDRDVTSLVLQPKYMGSRCNMLLHRSDVAKCKAFSRNAYMIKDTILHSDKLLVTLYAELQEKYKELFNDKIEYILFDGELLPWNAMGKNMIEEEYIAPYIACDNEHRILRDTGFQDMLASYDASMSSLSDGDGKRMSYEEFKPDILHVDVMQESLYKYKKQIDIFNATYDLEFKPFAILKTVALDGTEENWISSDHTNIFLFAAMADSPYCFIDLDKEKFMVFTGDEYKEFMDDKLAIAYFWQLITQNKEMEGVVIKPNQTYIPGIAPYFKCRNTEYLRLTYGFDYDVLDVKKERLLKTKHISQKVAASIKEWELGRALLNVKMNDISIMNKEWLALYVKLISEQSKESELDPRL